jgi:hypothetical protein
MTDQMLRQPRLVQLPFPSVGRSVRVSDLTVQRIGLNVLIMGS